MKKGEAVSIPIPGPAEGIRELLSELETDRERVAEPDIEDLEAEIDEAVYDLFDLTEGERRVIEEYLAVF